MNYHVYVRPYGAFTRIFLAELAAILLVILVVRAVL
jgi:hypothetical protein